MKKFARLFDLENNQQVLLTIEERDDTNWAVQLRTEIAGISVEVGYVFDDKNAAYKMLNEITAEEVQNIRESIVKEFNEFKQ